MHENWALNRQSNWRVHRYWASYTLMSCTLLVLSFIWSYLVGMPFYSENLKPSLTGSPYTLFLVVILGVHHIIHPAAIAVTIPYFILKKYSGGYPKSYATIDPIPLSETRSSRIPYRALILSFIAVVVSILAIIVPLLFGGTGACPADHGTGSRSQILIEARSMVPRNA